MKKTKFKQTEIGMIPEDWGVKIIGDLAKINENTINKNYKEINIEYIDTSSVDKGHLVEVQKFKLEEAPSRAKRILKDNDILISTIRPNLKHFFFVEKSKKNLIGSTGFVVISSKEINPEFLYYYLTTDKYTDFLSSIADAHTSTYPSFNPSLIENSFCPYPNESEQNFIAKILSDLDSKIELNQQMNKTLEAIGQAIFKRWFIDFEFPNEKGKPYKSSGGEMVDSELGEIPKGWKIGILGEIISLKGGLSYNSQDISESGHPMITMGFISGKDRYCIEGLKHYKGEYQKQHITKPGDLVIATRDVTQERVHIGSPALIPDIFNNEEIIVATNVYKVLNESYLSNNFIYLLMRTKNYRDQIISSAKGTTVIMITKDAIENFKFVFPNNKISNLFEKFIITILKRLNSNDKEIKSLSQILDSLLPKLMSGKIRVPVEVRK